jgi:hypothetical protein
MRRPATPVRADRLAAAGLFAACVVCTAARADVIIAGYFGGIVDDGTYTNSGPVNTPFNPDAPITGSFMFDITTDSSRGSRSAVIPRSPATPAFTARRSRPRRLPISACKNGGAVETCRVPAICGRQGAVCLREGNAFGAASQQRFVRSTRLALVLPVK